MVKIKREKKIMGIAARITPKTHRKLVRRCQKEGVTVSDFINQVLVKELEDS